MRIALLPLFFLLFFETTTAQSSLRGIVKDRKAKPVAGVVVGVWGVTPSAPTTGLGQFEISLPMRDEFLPGSKLVFSVQKDGWSVLDESDLLSFVPRNPTDEIKIRMVKDSERDADLRQQEKNIRESIQREFKEQDERIRAALAAQNVSADSVARLHTRLAVLAAERDQALAQVSDMVKALYKVDLEAASQLYRDADSLTRAGKIRESYSLIEKADLEAQLEKIVEEEQQHKIRLEELAKGRRQIAETYVLQAKNAITDLDFAAAERAYDKAALADPENYDVVFAFADFLQEQNNLHKAARFYEKSLLLSTDDSGKASVLNNLGIVHISNQKMPEAEKAYNEALSILIKLADKNPDVFLPKVANTLNNLGAYYYRNQQMPEAEKAFNEALSIRIKLADKNPDAFLPDVAASLNSLGAYYYGNQQMLEAEKAYNEALSIRRKLADKNPEAFLKYLATTLNNLGVFYRDNQRMPEAEKAYNEALSIQRKLADKNPYAFLPDVASMLNNLGVFYLDNQKMPEAETAYNEALNIQRKLADKNPDAFLPDLAMTLNNLGNYYIDNQKMPEAEKAFNEALSTYRKLADKNPDAFLQYVAMTLNNLGNYYYENQKMPEAEKAYNEALSIRRKLADKNPDAFLPDVAGTINNLGIYYYANQKMPEAEKAYNEALSTYRKLADKNPDAFLPNVAETLNNIGVYYLKSKNFPKALDHYEEALSIRQAALMGGQAHFFEYWVQVFSDVSNLKDSTETQKQYALTVRAAHLMAANCDSLRQLYPEYAVRAVAAYGSLSRWAVFAKEYALAEQAGLRCLALDEHQTYVWTNIGHALWLSGKEKEAKEAWLHLKGINDGEGKPYAQVLEKDWQDLASEGVVPPKAFDAARKWLAEKW